MKKVLLIAAACLCFILPACSAGVTADIKTQGQPKVTQTEKAALPDAVSSAGTTIIKQPVFSQRLNLAFGLFSIGLPQGSKAKDSRNPVLFQESYNITDPKIKIAANFASLESYEKTAYAKYNSMVSYFYVLIDPKDYTETPLKEETLENNVKIKWELMKGGNTRCIIFEAFSEKYGYNFALYSNDTKVTDQTLIDMMHSFQYNGAVENNIIDLKHTKNNDGTFVSVDNSLKITLNKEWEDAPRIMGQGIVFGLEWNDAETLIELYRYDDISAKDQSKDFNSFINYLKKMPANANAVWGETTTITLENLSNTDAYIVEGDSKEDTGVMSQSICFMYKGYCYMGQFMWMKRLDSEKRPEMEAAIHSLTANN